MSSSNEHHDEPQFREHVESSKASESVADVATHEGASPKGAAGATEQAVRFSSQLQEIEPEHSLQTAQTLTADSQEASAESMSPEVEAEIQNLALGLRDSHLQHRRMSHFAFEPCSLPPSRVPSNAQSSRDSRSAFQRHTPSNSSMHTPPLTPAESANRDAAQLPTKAQGQDPTRFSVNPQMTPQTSNPQKVSPTRPVDATSESRGTSYSEPSRPPSSGQTAAHPAALSSGNSLGVEDEHDSPPNTAHFSAGPADSSAASRDDSPLPSPRHGSGSMTPPGPYSRPFTPVGDRDDPYARSKRPPQPRNLDAIDARFKFEGKDSRRHSAMATAAGLIGSLPRSSSSDDLKTKEKQPSTFSLPLLGKRDQIGHLQDDAASSSGKHHSSMADLKRFLRIGTGKRSQSPNAAKSKLNDKAGTRTPLAHMHPSTIPFAEDHGLESKYGKFGKVLGAGAGGSVRLMKRSSDGVTFAVKQFRDRHSYESEREYAKKVTAEFCIGSTLHHGNIIETLDIIHEKGHWYEVMEYAPYDLFAVVMTAKMSREEISCSFLQIFAGVTYLHSMGLAHRDLKLDNVVVNEHGIMKLIDFGSATVFMYPFEKDIVLATGIVGSDPYLAPEVYESPKYDPRPADVWSLAIIFACMTLRRFPWKLPRLSDNSYKLFASAPTPGTVPAESRPKSTSDLPAAAEDARRKPGPRPETQSDPVSHTSQHHHHHRHRSDATEPELAESSANAASASGTRSDAPNVKPEVLKGPWRLLRLLPRETRSIIGRMLEVDPMQRATVSDMLEDQWITTTPVCRQAEGTGEVYRAEAHRHTLEPGTAATPVPSQK